MNDPLTVINADALSALRTLPDACVDCCVTSPPYWGLRDYDVAGQLGLEKNPGEFIAKLVQIFEEVRRVLKSDGTCWVNMGDCHTDGGRGKDTGSTLDGTRNNQRESRKATIRESFKGLRKKNLLGQPWRLAFALQDAGWNLRQDIIWHKPNPMPESVRDRPTKSHEYIFLLSKSLRYHYDQKAIQERGSPDTHARYARARSPDNKHANGAGGQKFQTIARTFDGVNAKIRERTGTSSRMNVDRVPRPREKQNASFSAAVKDIVAFRNKRSVWTVPTKGYKGAHFATFPPALIRPCVLAGCRPGGTVLDPFAGSGTTGAVALEHGRRALLIELNPAYCLLIQQRCMILGLGL